MVANKERPTPVRDMVTPVNPDAVKRMGGAPQQKPQQRVRQQKYRIGQRGQRHRRSNEEDHPRVVRPKTQQVIHAGGQETAGAGDEIGGSENACLVLFAGPMLHDGVDRHRKKSGKKTQPRQMPEHADEPETRPGEQAGKRGHPDESQRDKAVFDFATGQIAGGHTADADTDGQSGHEIADVRFVAIERKPPMGEQVQKEQCGQEPEKRVADHRQAQHPVAPNDAPLAEQLTDKIEPQRMRGVGRRYARDGRTRQQAEDSQSYQHQARPRRPGFKN